MARSARVQPILMSTGSASDSGRLLHSPTVPSTVWYGYAFASPCWYAGSASPASSSSATTSAPEADDVPGGGRRVGVVGVDVVGGDGEIAAAARLVGELPAEEADPGEDRQQQRDQRGRRAAQHRERPAAPGCPGPATAGRSPADCPGFPPALGIWACRSISRPSRTASTASTMPRRHMPSGRHQFRRRSAREPARPGSWPCPGSVMYACAISLSSLPCSAAPRLWFTDPRRWPVMRFLRSEDGAVTGRGSAPTRVHDSGCDRTGMIRSYGGAARAVRGESHRARRCREPRSSARRRVRTGPYALQDHVDDVRREARRAVPSTRGGWRGPASGRRRGRRWSPGRGRRGSHRSPCRASAPRAAPRGGPV